MPKPCPREFREDVIRVARSREPGVRIKDIAADFGITEPCLTNWLARADRDDGIKPGPTTAELAELREAKKRIRLLEQENEVLRRAARICPRRTCRESDVPARPRVGRRRDPRHGDVPGPQPLPCPVLPVARHTDHRPAARRSLARERDLRRPPR
jgi:transposase